MNLPEPTRLAGFLGVQRISEDRYVVAVPIDVAGDSLGRLLIIFSLMGFDDELRQIFTQISVLALSLWVLLVLMTAGVTWIILQPLLRLKNL